MTLALNLCAVLLLVTASGANGMRSDASAHTRESAETGAAANGTEKVEVHASMETVLAGKDCAIPEKAAKRYPFVKFLASPKGICTYEASRNLVVKIMDKKSSGDLRWECYHQLRKIHTTACATGNKDLLDLVERHLPTCKTVAIEGDKAYLVREAPRGQVLGTVIRDFYPGDAEKVFAQIAAALYALHSTGYAHNDAQVDSIYVDRLEDGEVLVALTNLEKVELLKLSKACRDAEILFQAAARMSSCERPKKRNVSKFLTCLANEWGFDSSFQQVLTKVWDATKAGTQEQHIKEVYSSAFVQKNLPKVRQIFYSVPANKVGSCVKQ